MTTLTAGRVRLCFGSKTALAQAAHHLVANGYGSHAEWLSRLA